MHAHAHNAVSETRLSDGAVLGVVGDANGGKANLLITSSEARRRDSSP